MIWSDVYTALLTANGLPGIVKSIESEKVSEEERDRLRDLWARIDSVNDKVRIVL